MEAFALTTMIAVNTCTVLAMLCRRPASPPRPCPCPVPYRTGAVVAALPAEDARRVTELAARVATKRRRPF